MKRLIIFLVVLLVSCGTSQAQAPYVPHGELIYTSRLTPQVDPHQTKYSLRVENHPDFMGWFYHNTSDIYLETEVYHDPQWKSSVMAHELLHLWEWHHARDQFKQQDFACRANPGAYGFETRYAWDPKGISLDYWCTTTEIHARYYAAEYFRWCGTATGPLGDPTGRSCKWAPSIPDTIKKGLDSGRLTN